jgi:hypothetical protein
MPEKGFYEKPQVVKEGRLRDITAGELTRPLPG